MATIFPNLEHWVAEDIWPGRSVGGEVERAEDKSSLFFSFPFFLANYHSNTLENVAMVP